MYKALLNIVKALYKLYILNVYLKLSKNIIFVYNKKI